MWLKAVLVNDKAFVFSMRINNKSDVPVTVNIRNVKVAISLNTCSYFSAAQRREMTNQEHATPTLLSNWQLKNAIYSDLVNCESTNTFLIQKTLVQEYQSTS